MRQDQDIVGKYEVRGVTEYNRHSIYHTDNPIEAMWLANKFPNTRTPVNICGEREFVKEKGRWKLIPLP